MRSFSCGRKATVLCTLLINAQCCDAEYRNVGALRFRAEREGQIIGLQGVAENTHLRISCNLS